MTLSIDVFIRNKDGERMIIACENPGDDLGGFESFRQQLYGCDQAIRLGLTLLPALRHTYGVIAESNRELMQLEREAKTLLQNLDAIFPGASLDEAFTPAHRLRNVIKAARRARRIGGGVVIW